MSAAIKPESEYHSIVKECADQGKALAQRQASAGICETLYLYYRKSEPGKSGKLFLARDSAPNPEGLPLATGEGLRSNIPFESYYQWVYERARSCPILAY